MLTTADRTHVFDVRRARQEPAGEQRDHDVWGRLWA